MKTKPDPDEIPEATPRPRVTYQTGTGGSTFIDPAPEPADTNKADKEKIDAD